MESALFIVFVNGLNTKLKGMLGEFIGNIKLGGDADSLEGEERPCRENLTN